MYELSWHNSFKIAFKKNTKNNLVLRQKIISTLELLQDNPFNPKLKTHKLHGKLQDCWASIVEYDCRIVFEFTLHPVSRNKIIALIDIGNHDEVY